MNRALAPSLLAPLVFMAACGGDGKTCTIESANGVQTLACPDGTNSTIGTGSTTSGTDGANGAVTVVSVVAEPAGANCPDGGKKVETGVDTNGNGVLDPSEVLVDATTCPPPPAP